MSDIPLPPRDQIDSKFKLNIKRLFHSSDSWEDEASAIEHGLIQLRQYKGQLAKNASTLADALELMFSLKERESKVFAFAQFS